MCTNFAWCAGMMACHACTDCINASFKQQVRLAYFVFDSIFVALGILLLYGLSGLLSEIGFIETIISKYIQCQPGGGGIASCLGVSSIYRLSLALAAMHVLILLMLLLRNGCSRVFNEEVWPFKILLIVGVFCGCMFIKNDSFQIYSSISMVAGAIFLLFQIVMLIDLFYTWGVRWVKNYDEGGNGWMYLLIITTVVLYGGALYFIINSFKSFSGIGIGTFVCVVNVVFVIVSAILVCARLNPDASLLTAAAFALITSFLTWSGLANMDDPRNELRKDESTTIISLVVGLVFVITSLIYVSLGDSDDTSGQMKTGGVNIPQAVLTEQKNEDDEKRQRLDEEEQAGLANKDAKEIKKELSQNIYQTNSFIYFHLILLFASCYVCMLLTNWGNPVINGKEFIDFQAGNRSMWMKLATSWATTILYVWTLVAPALCPDRDFS